MSKGPLIFCITNLGLMTPKRTYCGVLEFVAEEGTEYSNRRVVLHSQLDVQDAQLHRGGLARPDIPSSGHQE